MLAHRFLNLMFPAAPKGRLPILIYHRVHASPDPLFPDEVDAQRFDAICSWLARGFRVLPLDQAVAQLKAGTLPARALSITFDDGYADNHDVAMPILQRHGLCATFFVATGFLDGGRMWNDTVIEALRACKLPELNLDNLPAGISLGRHALSDMASRRTAIDTLIRQIKYLEVDQRAALVAQIAERSEAVLPDDLMMTSAQVQALHRGGMQIGGHTVNHPILMRLDDLAAREEMRQGKDRLETITGAPVRLFAYPNGRPGEDYDARIATLAREVGFEAAVTTAWGAVGSGPGLDLFQLPRFTPWDRSRGRYFWRLWRSTWHQPVRYAQPG